MTELCIQLRRSSYLDFNLFMISLYLSTIQFRESGITITTPMIGIKIWLIQSRTSLDASTCFCFMQPVLLSIRRDVKNKNHVIIELWPVARKTYDIDRNTYLCCRGSHTPCSTLHMTDPLSYSELGVDNLCNQL